MNYPLCCRRMPEKGITFVQDPPPKNSGTKLFEEVAAIREKQQEYDAHLTVMGTRNSYSKTSRCYIYAHERRPHENGQLKPAYNLQLAVQSEYIIGLGLFRIQRDTRPRSRF